LYISVTNHGKFPDSPNNEIGRERKDQEFKTLWGVCIIKRRKANFV